MRWGANAITQVNGTDLFDEFGRITLADLTADATLYVSKQARKAQILTRCISISLIP